MNSIEELKEALRAVKDMAGLGDSPINCDNIGSLSWAAREATSIAYKFEGVNQSLSDGWKSVYDFLVKIAMQIRLEVNDLYSAIEKFAEATAGNESQIDSSVTKANEEAEQILAELGLE